MAKERDFKDHQIVSMPEWIQLLRSAWAWVILIVIWILAIMANSIASGASGLFASALFFVAFVFTIVGSAFTLLIIPAKLFFNDYPERLTAKAIEAKKDIQITVGRVQVSEINNTKRKCAICTKKTDQKCFYIYPHNLTNIGALGGLVGMIIYEILSKTIGHVWTSARDSFSGVKEFNPENGAFVYECVVCGVSNLEDAKNTEILIKQYGTKGLLGNWNIDRAKKFKTFKVMGE